MNPVENTTQSELNQFAMAAKRRMLIIKELEQAGQPLTAQDLYEKPAIRELSKGLYNVGYDLKALRGRKIKRIPSADSRHRFAYILNKQTTKEETNEVPNERVANNHSNLKSNTAYLKMFLSDEEYRGFLKGYLLIKPESREDILKELQQAA